MINLISLKYNTVEVKNNEEKLSEQLQLWKKATYKNEKQQALVN